MLKFDDYALMITLIWHSCGRDNAAAQQALERLLMIKGMLGTPEYQPEWQKALDRGNALLRASGNPLGDLVQVRPQ